MRVNGLFGNTQFLGEIIHSNAFESKRQEHISGLVEYFFFHKGANIDKETINTNKVSYVLQFFNIFGKARDSLDFKDH